MSIAKTLPMKFKAMHYALLAFITQSDEFPAELKGGLIAKLPVLDSIENQVLFYEKMVEFKSVEKDIIKPMMKKEKQDKIESNKPVKEKKPRASKKKATAPVVAGVEVAAIPAAVSVPESAIPEVPVAPEKLKKKKES